MCIIVRVTSVEQVSIYQSFKKKTVLLFIISVNSRQNINNFLNKIIFWFLWVFLKQEKYVG